MTHKFHKVLCLVLALTMVIGLLPVGLFASAATVVEIGAGQVLVDDDFADYMDKQTVETKIAGITYRGIKGTNAFATMTEGVNKASGGTVFVGPGHYRESLSVNGNISIYGANMNINPNMDDWTMNAKRNNPENESIYEGTLTITAKALTKFVFNGFSVTGQSTIAEKTSGGSNKGFDISYNVFYDTIDISSTQGIWSMINTTERSGQIAYNRVVNSGSAKPLTLRNGNNFVIKGNYINCSSNALWMSAEMADGNATPGKMKIELSDNYITAGTYCGQFILHTAEYVDIKVTNNILKGTYPLSFNSTVTATIEKNIYVEGNDLTGSTQDLAFLTASVPYMPQLVTVRKNIFENSKVGNLWESDQPLDLSYNYFAKSSLSISFTPAPILYPMYTNSAMTKLTGDMQLESIQLSAIKANGDRDTITGAVIDNDAKTAKLKDDTDSIYTAMEVTAITKEADADVDVEYYSDADCTKKLKNGNVVDYLKKGSNLVYIKLITSLDSYSYRIYTFSIPRVASHECEVLDVLNFEGDVTGQTISMTIPAEEISPNIQLNVSAGATYQLYLDEACQTAVSGTILNNLIAGRSVYYVKAVAEDGITAQVYKLIVTRIPSTAAEIISINSPKFVAFNDSENAYLGVYSSDVDTASVDVTVSDKATWKLYSDKACTEEAGATDIALQQKDNVFYIKVSAESGVVTKVYKLILRRETPDSSKEIKAVLGSVISSEVTGDTVSVSLAASVQDYLPTFDFIGAGWKLYAAMNSGVLSDPIANNTILDVAAGKHTYYIEVLAKDGSAKVYTFVVDRKASGECKLLEISGGTRYYVDRFDFIATTEVQSDGAFAPKFVASPKATVTVSNAQGAPVSMPLMLRPGVNEYNIVVTAENGTSKNTYQWIITCIGDGFEVLKGGVAISNAWQGEEFVNGTPVFATIGDKVYKAYIGETAFADFQSARTIAKQKNAIVYVMPGTVLGEKITLDGLKLYGANFALDPNISNRYSESVLTGQVIANAGATVQGFTFTETANITVGAGSVTISNNIFADEQQREQSAIVLNTKDVQYDAIVIENNLFKLKSEAEAVVMNNVLSASLTDNVFESKTVGSAVCIRTVLAGGMLQIMGNVFTMPKATVLCLNDNVTRAGALNIRDNTFTAAKALSFNADKAASGLLLNFNGNKTVTTQLAVYVYDARALFAGAFTANENTFDGIQHSFMVEYATGVNTAALKAVDIEYNYYGTATPGNEWFDTTYDYKPYYVDEAMSFASDTVQSVAIKADGRAITDDGIGMYAVIPGNTATVSTAFETVAGLASEAYGQTYVYANPKAPTYDTELPVTMNGQKQVVYVTVISLDETNRNTYEITLYPQTANPVYNVYEVENCFVNGMTVNVIVANRATAWKPAIAVIGNAPISLFSDAACKKQLTGAVKLAEETATVYGVVEGYETVTFNIYKKLSSDKAILSMKDAYQLNYTGSDTLDVMLDQTKNTVDLTATVSDGASYQAYSDADLLHPITLTAIDAATVTKLYIKVTAADESYKVFALSLKRIAVVAPDLLSVYGTKTLSLNGTDLKASVSSYNATEGFQLKLQTNAGCTYMLYADPEHELILKNNTVFFAANYVYVYAVITSPDGVKSKAYTIELQKNASKVKFADAIPGWAQSAVSNIKDLGIVTGSKTDKGLMLDANGRTTREMMACFIARMLGVDITQYSYVDLESEFSDADQISSWALNAMKTCVALGIFGGSKDGDSYKLDPKSNITREQFAAVFVRAIKAEDVNVKAYRLPYKDAAKVSTWAVSYVKIISKLGLMKGSYGYFAPKSGITRVEIIQTIYNYMK